MTLVSGGIIGSWLAAWVQHFVITRGNRFGFISTTCYSGVARASWCRHYSGVRWVPWRFKDTLHPVHMRQPVVAVGTKHCHPVNAVDTKGCCCNTCFGCFHRLVYPQHRICKGVADYLSEVSQSSKAEWWIYFVLWLGLWKFWPWPWRNNQIQYKGALLPPWINFNPSMDK